MKLNLGLLLLISTHFLVGMERPYEEDLLVYVPFEETLGDTQHKLILNQCGDPNIVFIPSPIGRAIQINKSNNLRSVKEDDFLDSSTLTVAFWFMISSDSGTFMWNGFHSWNVAIDAIEGVLSYGPAVTTPKETIRKNEWYHVVLIGDYSQNKGRIFINGELVAEDRAPPIGGVGSRLRIGSHPFENSHFSGGLDDFIVWGRALKVEEVSALWTEIDDAPFFKIMEDTDLDQIPDQWELDHLPAEFEGELNWFTLDGDADFDNIEDRREFLRGTDPVAEDTDGDGLNDQVETGTGRFVSDQDSGTNPNWSDSDCDGVNDSIEMRNTLLDPLNDDSDGDGFTDGDELIDGDPELARILPDFSRSLHAYWPFDESLEDHSPNKFHAEMNEDMATFSPGLVRGHSLLLRNGHFVTVETFNKNAFSFRNGPFSVSAWFHAADLSWINNIIANGGSSRSWGVVISSDSTPLRKGLFFHLGSATQTRPINKYVSNAPIATATTYHLLVVYDRDGFYGGAESSSIRTYLNGERVPLGVDSGNSPEFRRTRESLRIGNFFTRGNESAWNGWLDDIAIWSRALTDSDARHLYREGTFNRKSLRDLMAPDTDGDGLPDYWEEQHSLATHDSSDRDQDPDNDGHTNIVEYNRGTNPLNPDTDGDGLLDSAESNTSLWVDQLNTGTNPLRMDSDGDGISDWLELRGVRPRTSDPNRTDSDGDAVSDGEEYRYGSDPLDPQSVPTLSSGLIAYWPFDGDLDNSISNRFAGIYHGDREAQYAVGRFNECLEFNGQEYVDITGSEDIMNFNESNFTLSAWIKRKVSVIQRGPFSLPTVMAKGDSGKFWRLFMRSDGHNRREIWWSAQPAILRHELDSGEFVHVAVIVDRIKRRSAMYINGSEIVPSDQTLIGAEMIP